MKGVDQKKKKKEKFWALDILIFIGGENEEDSAKESEKQWPEIEEKIKWVWCYASQ